MRVVSLLVLAACAPSPKDTGAATPEVPTADTSGLETGADSSNPTDTGDPARAGDLTSCPVASVWPRALIWSDTREGYKASQTVLVQNNCLGDAALSAAARWSGGTSEAFSGTLELSPLAAGETGVMELVFTPSDFNAAVGSIVITTNDPKVPTVTVSLMGQAPTDYDGDGYTDVAAGGTDCDDGSSATHPGATEVYYDGIDQDCAPGDDDDLDSDGFGSVLAGGADCDDTNDAIYPGAPEIWYDGVDSDCAGDSDDDADRDGQDAAAYGGADCDDADPSIYLGAPDAPYDGIDSDCAGGTDNDADGDGYDAIGYSGTDCNDTRADVYPGAPDAPYDGVDANCAGDSDNDADGDGYDAVPFGGPDCDDRRADVHPGATDTPYDGIDTDCGGGSDNDADGDGADAAAYGGTDCDDTDASVYSSARDTWYDGVDSDCAGDDDYDADGDGQDADSYGGTDCDDTRASVYAGAPETWYDGIDSDCAGDDDYDADGDGDESFEFGGTDCDDTSPDVYAGAYDAPYDGIDTDCVGDSDFDADGDGADAEVYGGTDCDDGDATVHPGATELADLEDQDCDGLIDEDFVSAGDVLISEVMLNPAAVSDRNGEWIELQNVSDTTIDLQGWDINAGGGAAINLSSSLVLAPGARMVIGANDDSATNGGVTIDYAYTDPPLTLSDTDGMLSLEMGDTVIFTLSWFSGWDLVEGASLSLDPSILTAGEAALSGSWCAATSLFGDGDLGTPGGENDACDSLDADGDGFSTVEGDCDNADASINPDAEEVYNGVDDDCDGFTDDLDPDAVSLGSVQGTRSGAYLSRNRSLSVADLDNDGSPEIITGSLTLSSNYGVVYIVDGNALAHDKATVSAHATASVFGEASYNYLAEVGPTQGDNNGDGKLDLFVAGSDYWWTTGTYAGEMFFGAGSRTGIQRASSADALLSTGSSAFDYAPATISSLDIDGDGLDDVVWGNFFESGTSKTIYYAGRAYVVTGDDIADGGVLSMKSDAVALYGDDRYDYLGQTVGGGDADGDGYDDILLVAPYDSVGGSSAGTVYFVAGGSSLPAGGKAASRMALSVSATTADAHLCQGAIPQLADFDGDGAMDLAVSTDNSLAGTRAWVFSDIGAAMGTGAAITVDDATVAITDRGSAFPSADAYYSGMGQALASGDFNHDGVTDLAVGGGFSVYTYSPYAISHGGAAWLFSLASVSGTVDSSTAFASVGLDAMVYGNGSVLAAGDLLGDGNDDLIFANPWASSSVGMVWFVPF